MTDSFPDQIAAKLSLADAYAQDGAYNSAARVYREIAELHDNMHASMMAECAAIIGD